MIYFSTDWGNDRRETGGNIISYILQLSTMTGPSQSSLHESPLSLRHDEEIEETIEQGADQIIITNHRLCLAGADTAGIDWAIERQNVDTVQATSIGGERLRTWGVVVYSSDHLCS